MDDRRRKFLQGAAAAGGAATFAAGYAAPLEKLGRGLSGSAGERPAHAIYGDAPAPEYRVDLSTGALTSNPDQRMAFTVCYGCTSSCGVRVRIDAATDRVIRVAGNPYNPLSADRHLAQDAPVADAMRELSALGSHESRATACARGAAMIEQIESPHRVLSVLKRRGPRGGDDWETVPFEQAIEEICAGGDLFGEGHVDGLAAIADPDTPIDPDNPEYGPRANQLMVMEATDYGRSAILRRFAFNAFGTRNYGHHGSYCGLAFRMGSGAMMGDMANYEHVKPDLARAEFALFVGTAPSQAGNPFKRSGRLLAEARARGTLDYAVVDPALNAAVTDAGRDRGQWVPIRPGSDSALAMALIGWLLDNDGYAADYLARPTAAAAEDAGDVGHTNATHLVITGDDPRAGRGLRASDLGLAEAGAEDDTAMVRAQGRIVPAPQAATADLWVDAPVALADGTTVKVQSGLWLLRQAARAHTLAEYSAACGIPEDRIVDLGTRFKAAGRRAVVDCHGGMMSGAGFHAAFGLMVLNVLAGSLNHAGGTAHGGGAFNGVGRGPLYDLATFPGMRRPQGIFLSRSRMPYERSSEFARKQAAGESPYPARAPWRSLAPPILTEHLASALDGYPYPLKAVISCMNNALYAQPGLAGLVTDRLRDPRRLGLFVAIDGFINETNRYADYIFPDSVMYEVWGFTGAWRGNLTKMTTACWPVVAPRQDRTADGQPISMESVFIALARRLGLPGFGEAAIPAADGRMLPLERAEDFFLRAAANIAHQDTPLPDATAEDIALAGLDPLMPMIEAVLPEAERGPVAQLYSRGGRHQPYAAAVSGDRLGNRWTTALCVHNETVATATDSQTGRRHPGTPIWQVPRLSDGTPMRDAFPEAEWPMLAFSFKSQLMGGYSAGLDRLRMIRPNNPVLVNDADAEALGIAHGDVIEVESPGGRITGVALVSPGVMRGALGIEHGFGHRDLGARVHRIDGVERPGNPWIGAGVTLNDLGFADPTRGVLGTWLEPVTGAAVRQGLPVRLRRAA
ncbi:molybdopterin dinucleotide binding domain-containing protein [Rhodobaculum claviforme]|uniref:Tetrathionate reductase subunit A n=1 Tax=Rhodobaculum claviforme TaxID=1549854 RepID=A0A934TN98_9RHOB|nr:molybdopterin dinucleotide binding domain-containing protein [Rhodobaculum claviforme]MBK5928218.1 tetrathionate reductase subunit A [Rhodobaculum claviforme]